MIPRLVIAGGSGFLGSVLTEFSSARGNEIVILTRKANATSRPNLRGALGGHDGR
jgi:NAD dependent epimerase/dehydratase family enzyme